MDPVIVIQGIVALTAFGTMVIAAFGVYLGLGKLTRIEVHVDGNADRQNARIDELTEQLKKVNADAVAAAALALREKDELAARPTPMV